MNKKNLFIAICLLITFWFFGCSASKEDVAQEKDEGMVNMYPVNIAQAWEIGKQVFKWKDCDKITEDKKTGYLIGEFESSALLKTGCFVGVWFESLTPDTTKVTVVSMKASKIQYVTSLSEDGFHESFEKGVKYVKAGKEFPKEDP